MAEIGDRVSYVNETGEGVITKVLSGNKIIVEGEDGFEMEYDLSEIIILNPDHYDSYDKSVDSASLSKDNITKLRNPVRHKKDVVEVDLHIEELVDDHRGWSNAEIVQFQLEKFESVLNTAFQTRKRKMVVIHGRGDGILRFEIRRKLQDYPGIEVYDANFKIYGQGATEILLHK